MRYENSETKHFPESWRLVKLKELISSCYNGIWGNDPSPDEVSFRVIRSTEITHDSKVDVTTAAERVIPAVKVEKYKLQDYDILLVASSGSPGLIGRVALFRQPVDNQVYLFSNFMMRLRPQNIDPHFLFHFFNSQEYYHFLKSLQQTSTGLRNLPKKNLLNAEIPCPPLPEQKKIAEILGTVDKAIEQVDTAIERTERLKNGLMQKLLTEGIDHNEFKDTEIGRIPKAWEIVRLCDVASNFISGGTPSTSNAMYWNGKIPWMTSAHINKKIITDGMKNITEEGIINSATNVVPRDNVLIATRVGIGKVAINTIDIAISQDLTGIVVDKTKIDLSYLYWQVSKYALRLRTVSQGSTIKGLLRKEIEKIRLPLPQFSEQWKIAEILNMIDIQLETYNHKKQKLLKIKQGLMSDLLTGKKRVRL